MTNPETDEYGNKRWRNEKGELHRENGPAVIFSSGAKSWFRNGKLHRLNGPAIISPRDEIFHFYTKSLVRNSGRESWYVNGEEIDIKPILERLDISPDWRNWTDAEKMIMRLALP